MHVVGQPNYSTPPAAHAVSLLQNVNRLKVVMRQKSSSVVSFVPKQKRHKTTTLKRRRRRGVERKREKVGTGHARIASLAASSFPGLCPCARLVCFSRIEAGLRTVSFVYFHA